MRGSSYGDSFSTLSAPANNLCFFLGSSSGAHTVCSWRARFGWFSRRCLCNIFRHLEHPSQSRPFCFDFSMGYNEWLGTFLLPKVRISAGIGNVYDDNLLSKVASTSGVYSIAEYLRAESCFSMSLRPLVCWNWFLPLGARIRRVWNFVPPRTVSRD